MSWKAIARSAIGTSHQKQQMPCQDYGSCQIFDNLIIGAVADGAGSAKYADLGAKLTVKTALKYLTAKKIEEWSIEKKPFWQLNSHPFSEKDARKLFTETINRVRSVLQKQAANDDYSIEDLACTLAIVVATPNWLTAMQIGDGFIVVRDREEDVRLLFSPDKGEYINETTFVTSINALEAMRVSVQFGHPEFVCVSTDGLERLAIRISDWTPFTPFFQPLEEYLRESDRLEEEDEYLMDFLNSDRLNARTDDDKTLLLCLYDNSSHSR
ncbi:MAG: PP2C family serine/threonine-protein phosphatase [Xenococcaceae cyanobacterium]